MTPNTSAPDATMAAIVLVSLDMVGFSFLGSLPACLMRRDMAALGLPWCVVCLYCELSRATGHRRWSHRLGNRLVERCDDRQRCAGVPRRQRQCRRSCRRWRPPRPGTWARAASSARRRPLLVSVAFDVGESVRSRFRSTGSSQARSCRTPRTAAPCSRSRWRRRSTDRPFWEEVQENPPLIVPGLAHEPDGRRHPRNQRERNRTWRRRPVRRSVSRYFPSPRRVGFR